MRILDKYIIKEMLGPLVFGVAAFSSIFIGTNVLLKLTKYISQYDASMVTVIKLFIYNLPLILVRTFPMAMLLASLLAFSRLSGSSEITAMKSGGLSFFRLTVPVIILALFVSIVAVAFNEALVPAANNAYDHIVRYEVQKNTSPVTQEDVIIKDIQFGKLQQLTYAKNFIEETSTMNKIAVQEFADGRLVRTENAEKAVWQGDRWLMVNGTTTEFADDTRIAHMRSFTEKEMPVRMSPASIALAQKDPEDMTMKELSQHIALLKQEFVAANSYEVEYYQRLAVPLASLVFAMIGTPLGLSNHRSNSSIGLGLSIIIILIYYSLLTISTALGKGGVVHPFVAAWIPNLIGILAGFYLVAKSSR
ncbi:LptF/LptG family permease [Sporomusa acidovorans]|uniref:Lipopolysaccharide export system permease protein LptG n=1 Tax=Sporomusa acidovorans (strain ATCC 49682 / DSM 3132 / Mol) TaxID=1123286 RepID=A0ABZ3J7Z4_SPOA4|nr:LptF/LptG family permease [Sporomusa acidovorans]OZC19310.1 putative permease YjgP/YjgQ family protein [Sporomusa acidovorans DSM 3132]SDD81159.1 lipopolysaccharide export system permease protein [Sporomusa acidovorans]